jgi:hypothetical protein
MRELRVVVRAMWDPEARVWVATSEDVPGLITEAGNLDALEAKLRDLIPELLIENEVLEPDGPLEIPMEIIASQRLRVQAAE